MFVYVVLAKYEWEPYQLIGVHLNEEDALEEMRRAVLDWDYSTVEKWDAATSKPDNSFFYEEYKGASK